MSVLTDEQIADGWIEHDGGPCPVDASTPVEILVRAGDVSTWKRAGAVLWQYGSFVAEIFDALPRCCEVIAYRMPKL